jgi:hypothetical protein
MRTVKSGCLFVLVLCTLSLATDCPYPGYHHPCGQVHNWSLGNPLYISGIVREHAQIWHHVGTQTRFHVNVDDWDYVDCCASADHTGNVPDNLFFSWEGQDLIEPADGYTAVWWPRHYTATTIPIKVHVWNLAYMLDCWCDAGERDDSDQEKTIQVGAWQAQATMTVSGTNKIVPETATALELEYYDYSVYPYELTGAPPKDIPVSLNSSHISLGNYDDNVLISPDPQEVTLTPAITSQAEWTMSCLPSDAWDADAGGFVQCVVDRQITGHIRSKVWDDDVDISGGSVTVGVSFVAPPLSISVSHDFDLASDAARSQVAVGFGSKSDVPGAPYESKVEHTDDSNLYMYTGTDPYIGMKSIDFPWSPKVWCTDRSSNKKTSSMMTKTEGWVKAQESTTYVSQGPGMPPMEVHNDAYVEAWQAGTITYRLTAPLYYGTKHANPNWDSRW